MQSQDFSEVGQIKEIWRYPVKSMAGERLETANIGWYGIEGDRRAAFIRGDDHSGFPWLTARQVPQLVQYRPQYTDLDDLKNSPMIVETPHGRTVPLDSAELLDELVQAYGHSVSLIRIKRGVFDTLTVSLMSTATVKALDEAVEEFEVDRRRFRQNIIIETFDGRPFVEENWVNEVLAIGQARVRLNERIPRCQMINVDPDTAVRRSRVLKVVAQTRDNCVGVGCTADVAGEIRVGDVVRLVIE